MYFSILEHTLYVNLFPNLFGIAQTQSVVNVSYPAIHLPSSMLKVRKYRSVRMSCYNLVQLSESVGLLTHRSELPELCAMEPRDGMHVYEIKLPGWE